MNWLVLISDFVDRPCITASERFEKLNRSYVGLYQLGGFLPELAVIEAFVDHS